MTKEDVVPLSVLVECGVLTQIAHYYMDNNDPGQLKKILSYGAKVIAKDQGQTLIKKAITKNLPEMWDVLYAADPIGCAASVDGISSAVEVGNRKVFNDMIGALGRSKVLWAIKQNIVKWLEEDNQWALKAALNAMGETKLSSQLIGHNISNALMVVSKNYNEDFFADLLEICKKIKWGNIGNSGMLAICGNGWSHDNYFEETLLSNLLKSRNYKAAEDVVSAGYLGESCRNEVLEAIANGVNIDGIKWLVNHGAPVFNQEDKTGRYAEVKSSFQVEEIIRQCKLNMGGCGGRSWVDVGDSIESLDGNEFCAKWDYALNEAIARDKIEIAKFLMSQGSSLERIIKYPLRMSGLSSDERRQKVERFALIISNNLQPNKNKNGIVL